MTYKTAVSSLVGFIGGFVTFIIGDITPNLLTLMLLMLIDLLTGFITACVFKNSAKTESGSLSSREMLKGICRKAGMILLVCLGYQMDKVLATDYVKATVIIALIVEESLSVVENLGLMGLPIPDIIKKSIDVLNQKIKGE